MLQVIGSRWKKRNLGTQFSNQESAIAPVFPGDVSAADVLDMDASAVRCRLTLSLNFILNVTSNIDSLWTY